MSDSLSSLEPAATPPTPARWRQLRLFQVTNPITTRLGAEAFANLPRCPGVYFFYDVSGRLLYIGQSLNLRARVTSYRHVSPERHPRRILRLVHRIARIDWQTCETPEAAIELERTLLLQHRPPFNRAGTWQAPPWYLSLGVTHEDHLHLTLMRAETATSSSMAAASSPDERAPARSFSTADVLPALEFPSSVGLSLTRLPLPIPRAIHAALGRCLVRIHHPALPLSQYPAGLLNLTAPIDLCLPFPGHAQEMARLVTEFMSGRPGPLLTALEPLRAGSEISTLPLPEESSPAAMDTPAIPSYWAGQMELICTFAEKKLSLHHPGA